MWVLSEYFERQHLTDVDFIQEEPQQFKFDVTIQDPRPRFLLWPVPWRRWTLETPQQAPLRRDGGFCTFTFEFGLRPNDRPFDIQIVSSIDERSLLMIGTGMGGSAVGAVIIERVLMALF
jgi:hypothetical protein